MLLGFVLGSLLEDNRRRALLISGGSQLHWGFWIHNNDSPVVLLLSSDKCLPDDDRRLSLIDFTD
jgi:TctA family transporter